MVQKHRHVSRQIKTRHRVLPLTEYLRQRAKRRLVTWMVVAGLCTILVVADYQGWLSVHGGDWWRYHGGVFEVSRVVDGNTLIVRKSGGDDPQTAIVRLCGIDAAQAAPESHQRPLDPNAPMDDAATLLMRQLVRGQPVWLQLTRHRDQQGRLLAYVYLPDGTMLNERLLADGVAVVHGRDGHRLSDRFILILEQARANAFGVWSSGVELPNLPHPGPKEIEPDKPA